MLSPRKGLTYFLLAIFLFNTESHLLFAYDTSTLDRKIHLPSNIDELTSIELINKSLPDHLKTVTPFPPNYQFPDPSQLPNCFWYALSWHIPEKVKNAVGINFPEMQEELEKNFIEIEASDRKFGDIVTFSVNIRRWYPSKDDRRLEAHVFENELYHAAIYLENNLIFQKRKYRDLTYALAGIEEYSNFIRIDGTKNPRSDLIVSSPKIKYYRLKNANFEIKAYE